LKLPGARHIRTGQCNSSHPSVCGYGPRLGPYRSYGSCMQGHGAVPPSGTVWHIFHAVQCALFRVMGLRGPMMPSSVGRPGVSGLYHVTHLCRSPTLSGSEATLTFHYYMPLTSPVSRVTDRSQQPPAELLTHNHLTSAKAIWHGTTRYNAYAFLHKSG
jgi:hypothetical protein